MKGRGDESSLQQVSSETREAQHNTYLKSIPKAEAGFGGGRQCRTRRERSEASEWTLARYSSRRRRATYVVVVCGLWVVGVGGGNGGGLYHGRVIALFFRLGRKASMKEGMHPNLPLPLPVLLATRSPVPLKQDQGREGAH